MLAVVERRPTLVDRVPEAAADGLELGVTTWRTEAVGLRVDRGGRETLRL
jgi:hypothetical protein